MLDGIDLRCSAIVVRQQAVLLVHRVTGAGGDWVLPGGTPEPGESMAACVRREVAEETGLRVDPRQVAFVLEVSGHRPGERTLDIVFTASETAPGEEPRQMEPDMEPVFVAASELHALDLRPPLAGHIRGMLTHRRAAYAPYLANMWRPTAPRGEEVSVADVPGQ